MLQHVSQDCVGFLGAISRRLDFNLAIGNIGLVLLPVGYKLKPSYVILCIVAFIYYFLLKSFIISTPFQFFI